MSALGIPMYAHNSLPPAEKDEFGRRPEDFESKFVDGFLIRHLPNLSAFSIGFVIDWANKISLVHPDGGLEEIINPDTGKLVTKGLGPTALFHAGLYAVLWWFRQNQYPPPFLPKQIHLRTDLMTDAVGMTGTTWTFHRTLDDAPEFIYGARYGENIPFSYIHIHGKDAGRPHSDIDLRRPDTKIIHSKGTEDAVGDLCARYGIPPDQYFRIARMVMEQLLSMPKGYRCIITNNHGEECSEVFLQRQ
jgi:hypothetical protein